MNDTLWNALAVKMSELLDKKIILQENRAAVTGRQGMIIARNWSSKVITQWPFVSHQTSYVRHCRAPT
jgi:hypothetical protein